MTKKERARLLKKQDDICYQITKNGEMKGALGCLRLLLQGAEIEMRLKYEK